MCWFPTRGNMARSHQVMKLHHVDMINDQRHKQVFARSRGNPERTHTEEKKRSNISERKYKAPPTCSRGKKNQRPPSPNHYYIHVKVTEMKNTIYTNHTGKFLVTSRRGHKYLMIMFEVARNAILAETMKNKTEK